MKNLQKNHDDNIDKKRKPEKMFCFDSKELTKQMTGILSINNQKIYKKYKRKLCFDIPTTQQKKKK